ncbi:TPA: terminase small subunit [Clostridium botulinum]|uniref:terminase small subunit n=1 Tax=Clostridium botulinum TaxID=1491 RepID=UPI0008FCAD54|nr:terminase small subunit [Clostridium botulinum]APC79457.1 terminase small subunit [Clostridium botulinum]MCS4448637.1 terminase small subunit [Clostridium botulinum]MCS4459066.1 terminase small subunit [Clostridium botulinum]MCS4462453.1 terminase small subunit [Clostridium botulinum]MCS4512223.1 terminase small subunit [Clostridium botulinum]
MKLTPKQKAFADYYIETGNATEAAIKAGYSKKTARFIGNENLTKPYIKNYIDERMAQLEDERIAKANEVLQYLTRVIRGQETEEVVVTENIGDFMSEAKTIKKEIGAKDRIKAAELLGKRYRLFTDKVEIEGEIPVVISGGDKLED